MDKNKHREYLKEHEGLRYLKVKSKNEINRKWSLDYNDDKYEEDINLIEIRVDEIVIEFDETSNKDDSKKCSSDSRDKWFKQTIKNLEKEGIDFKVYDHKGKSPHIHLRLNRNASKEEKENIVKYYSPKQSHEFVDLSLCGIHLIAVPYAKHWKYGTMKELIENKEGRIINVDESKFKVVKKDEKVFTVKKTSGITDKIIERINITDLANEYGIIKGKGKNQNYHCPFHNDKHPSFSLNDDYGRFKCFTSSCGKTGNIVDFVSLMEGLTKKEALNKLIERANLRKEGRYSSIFNETDNGISVDYKLMAKIFLMDQPYFYDKHKLWWFWNSAIYKWEIVDDIDVMNEIDRGLRWSATIEKSIKGKILEALKRVGRLNTPKEPKRSWVQFNNNIIDIKTNKIFEATPEYFITNPIPWEIGESEETPTIDKIFEEWVGKDYVKTLKEIVAYCTLTYMPIHRIFCLIGCGLNGKGTFLRFIEKFVGEENATSTSIDRLTKGQFETSKIYKKLVAIIGEIDKSIFNKTALLKALSGDDLVPIEFKGKDSFDTHNYATPIIAANALPETTDKSKGFFRRWTIVDFPNEFNEKKDILGEIPNKEFNNFCKQCSTILRELLENGEFTNDGSIEERAERYKERSSPLNQFINACCEVGKEYRVEFSNFYDEFSLWLEQNGHDKISENMTARLLTNAGYEGSKPIPQISGGSTRFRLGLKLKGENENE